MLWQSLIRIIELQYELDFTLSILSREACKILNVGACSIFISDREGKVYTLSASTLIPAIKSGMIYIDVEDDLLGQVSLREEALIISDISKISKYTVLRTLSRSRFKSLLAAPVIHRGEVIAIIALQLTDGNKITENLQTDVATLCANLSLPLNRAINIEGVSERIEEQPENSMRFDGISANDGVQKGTAVARYNITDIEKIPDKPSQAEDEEKLFINAVEDVKESLKDMLQRVTLLTGKQEAQLFEAYLQMIDSSRFYDAIINYIRQGVWLQSAIKRVVIEQAKIFEQMSEPYLVERASDIRDLGKRILLALENKNLKQSHYSIDTILVASEVTASMIAETPKGQLKAIISEHGSSYSHAAILARALSIPFVTGIKALPVGFIDGKEVIVDAYVGRIYIQPGKRLKVAYDRLIKYESQKAAELQAIKGLPSMTLDGFKVALKANVGLIADLDMALNQGASGIGLYRSEVPFIIRERFPSENEQRIIYQQILSAFPEQPAVLRILDVGADKTLPYFYREEQNPALGWRGIRMLLDQSNLFLMQTRAMLKASLNHNNLHILLPMISNSEEIEESKLLIRQAYKEVVKEGFKINKPSVGIMIEVPSAVILSEQLMKMVDFVSIGSNDLAQYILAVDRTNEKVANLYNQLHPAVIRILYYLVKVAKKQHKTISLCGELGGNALATALLVGMGFDSLSMNASTLLKVKQVIRSVTRQQCRNVLKQVLKLTTSDEVHRYLENFLIENDLGGLIRAGIH